METLLPFCEQYRWDVITKGRFTPSLVGIKKLRAVSLDAALVPHFADAMTLLTNEWVWESVGDDVDDIVLACKDVVEEWYSNMMVGSVFPWLSTPPAGWLLLDGATYAESDYPELFAVLDDALKSGTDFTLPDVAAAFPYGVALASDAAQVSGSNTLNLTVGQLPAHTHTYTPPTLTIPAGPPPTTQVAGIGGAIASGSTGSGDDVDKRPLRFGLLYAVYAGRE